MSDPQKQMADALRAVVAAQDFVVPPFPAVVLRLQQAVADPHASVGKVADIVAGDPALLGAVLGAANSAVARAGDEITTVPRAVNRIGIRAVAAMAMASSVGKEALRSGVLFDAKYFAWRRTLTSAYLAQGLAERKKVEPERVFVVSILAGVGRAVALAALEKIIVKLKPSRPLEVGDWLKIAERHSRDLTHVVLRKWQLPAEILAAFDEESADNECGVISRRAEELALLLEKGEISPLLNADEGIAVAEAKREIPKALETLAPPPDKPSSSPEYVAPLSEKTDLFPPPPGFLVEDLRVKGRAQLSCVGVKDSMMRTESDRPFQSGSMVHLRVKREERELLLWLSVRSSTEVGKRHLVEFSLFSPSKEQRELWQQLVA